MDTNKIDLIKQFVKEFKLKYNIEIFYRYITDDDEYCMYYIDDQYKYPDINFEIFSGELIDKIFYKNDFFNFNFGYDYDFIGNRNYKYCIEINQNLDNAFIQNYSTNSFECKSETKSINESFLKGIDKLLLETYKNKIQYQSTALINNFNITANYVPQKSPIAA